MNKFLGVSLAVLVTGTAFGAYTISSIDYRDQYQNVSTKATPTPISEPIVIPEPVKTVESKPQYVDFCYHLDDCTAVRVRSKDLIVSNDKGKVYRVLYEHSNELKDPNDVPSFNGDLRESVVVCSKTRAQVVAKLDGENYSAIFFDFVNGVPGRTYNYANLYQAVCHNFYENELGDPGVATSMGYQPTMDVEIEFGPTLNPEELL